MWPLIKMHVEIVEDTKKSSCPKPNDNGSINQSM